MGIADWWIEYVNSIESDGVRVTPDSSLTYGPVWKAVSTISKDVASVPFLCHTVENDGDLIPDRSASAHYLMNVEPNAIMHAYTFRMTLQLHALLWGDGIALIQRDDMMRPRQLIPLLPHLTDIHLVNGQKIVETKLMRNEGEQPESRFYPATEYMHLLGLSYGGFRGYAISRYGREAIGLGMQAERHSSRIMKNNAVPSVALKTERNLSEEEATQFLMMWERKHGGDNVGSTAIAAGGLEIQPLSSSNRDNQHIEGRKFQVKDVANYFSIPAYMLGDDSNTAYNSLEAMRRDYYSQTLRQWFVAWESEGNSKLLTETQKRRGSKIWRHDVTELVRGDQNSQAEIAHKLVSAEVATRNEMRRWFNLPMSTDPIANELRNPNTRTDETESAAEGEEAPDTIQLRNAHVAMVRDRWQRTIETDIGKVTRAAKTVKNFVAWLDNHYSTVETKIDDSMRLLADSMVAFEGSEFQYAPGARYARDSKNILLDVAGSCVDDLHLRVAEATANWQDRVTTYLPEFDQT